MTNPDWIREFFGERPHRPDHPDLMKLSEVLLRMDSGIGPHQTDDQNHEAWQKRVGEVGIDERSLSYSATQRAFRMLGINDQTDLVIKMPQAIALSSAWIDGFVAGAFFERKSEVWYLTVDAKDGIATSLHRSEAECLQALRMNYDQGGEYADVPDEEIIQTLIDMEGLVIYMEGVTL